MERTSTATADDILQIGDPRLRVVAKPVSDPAAARDDARKVEDALQGFRDRHGFGRGTAATQLGIEKRIIALHMTDWPGAIFNPEITWRSPGSMTLWENCMSFPFMLAKVRRAESISVRYLDNDGVAHHRERLAVEVPTLAAWKDGQGELRNYQRIKARLGERLTWIGGPGSGSEDGVEGEADTPAATWSIRLQPVSRCSWAGVPVSRKGKSACPALR